MLNIGRKKIDEVRSLAYEAASGSMHPVEFGRAVVRYQVETEQGVQPLFFLVPTAVKTDDREPGIPMTTIDDAGNIVAPRLFLPGNRGGYQLIVRITTDPHVGSFVVSGDPNQAAQRLRVGGAGVTAANSNEFEYGVAGWRYPNASGPAQFLAHQQNLDFIDANPDTVIGWQESRT